MSGASILNLLKGPMPLPSLGGNPQSGQGASPSPSGGQGAAPAQGGGGGPAPPPQSQSPPDLAQLYMQLEQRNRSANEIDRGLSLMAASMSTPSMANAIMGSMPQQQDAGAMMGNMMKLQQQQIMMRQQQQAAAGAEGAFQSLFPGAPAGMGTELFNTGKFGDVVANHFASMNPTEAQKNADAAAKAYQAANPSASPEEVAQLKSNLLSGTVGGQTPVERDMRQDMMNWRMQPGNANKTNAQMLQEHPEFANTTVYAAKKAEQTKIATDAGAVKVDASNSFDTVDAGWKAVQDNVNWLADQKNRNAVVKAIQTPEFETTGQTGRFLGGVNTLTGGLVGPDDDTLQAKSRLDQLSAQLKSENFRNTKNVRSNREAQFLGDSATNLFKPTNNPQAIGDALTTLQNQTTAGRANATAAAGRQIPNEWAGNVDPALLDPNNPLYNGATLEPPPQQEGGAGGRQLSAADLAQAKVLIARDGRDSVIAHLKAKGYNTSGL